MKVRLSDAISGENGSKRWSRDWRAWPGHYSTPVRAGIGPCPFSGFQTRRYHVSPQTTWMDPPFISDLRRWGAPLTKVAPRCGESESSPFTKVAASQAGQVKGGVPCQAAATSRRTAPFMSVNAAPQLTHYKKGRPF